MLDLHRHGYNNKQSVYVKKVIKNEQPFQLKHHVKIVFQLAEQVKHRCEKSTQLL